MLSIAPASYPSFPECALALSQRASVARNKPYRTHSWVEQFASSCVRSVGNPGGVRYCERGKIMAHDLIAVIQTAVALQKA